MRPRKYLRAASCRKRSPRIVRRCSSAQLDQIIGAKGQNNAGVYAFAVPRRDPVIEGGMQLAPVGPMGVAQSINFQPTGGGKAAITGDFVLTADEVNPVIKALQQTVSRSRRSTATCSTNNHGCSSCISGPMTTPSSSPRGYAPHSTRPPVPRARRGGTGTCQSRKGTADEESCPHVVGAGRPPFRRSRSRGATVVQGMRGATQGVHEELRRACLQNRVPDVSKVMQVEAIGHGRKPPSRKAAR